MNAPDKIYRSYFYDTASEVYQSQPAEDADTCTEYIRKDTLIEKAKAYLRTDLDYFIDREEGSIDTEELIEDFILEVIEKQEQ